MYENFTQEYEEFQKNADEQAKAAAPPDGKSAFEYGWGEINMDQVLLGNRYLERKTGMFMVAPSGVGKSTAAIQLCALWSCDLPAFRIPPTSDLGIILFQSEDSHNDLVEMCRMIKHLELSSQRIALLKANFWIETVKGLLGKHAIERFKHVIAARKSAGQKVDLIVINPYTAYLLGDVVDTEPNNDFLRQQLDPLLSLFDIGALIVHHTPKTTNRDTRNWEFFDWMYSGAGSAAISNWARAFIAIEPVRKTELFRFIAAKRGERIEWENREMFMVHDPRPGIILWNEVDKPALSAARASARRSMTVEDLVKLVPLLDPIPKTVLREAAANAQFNRDSYRAALEQAILEEKLFVWHLDNKPERFIVAVSRSPQSNRNGQHQP